MAALKKQKQEKCWKCDCCFTVNKLSLSMMNKYDGRCYGCRVTVYEENKTPIIETANWDKPGHVLSQLKEEVDAESSAFPTEADMNQTIKQMDRNNTLLMHGWFRQHYGANMPASIIHYCIIYLFLHEDLYIGNLHERHPTKTHAHIWTMFVSSSNIRLMNPESIERITYDLHPSYKVSRVTVKKAPFWLRRVARGSFEVKATIVFKPMYNRQDLVCSHDLSYKHAVTLTHIEDDKTNKAKEGYEYFFKHDGVHYNDIKQFVIE